jgi:hypothetical protein
MHSFSPDKLLTMKFQNSMTRGFAAIGEPNVAVCLLPGTEIAFEKEVKYQRESRQTEDFRYAAALLAREPASRLRYR